jgi:conjugal transfer pilus assembly protein TraK
MRSINVQHFPKNTLAALIATGMLVASSSAFAQVPPPPSNPFVSGATTPGFASVSSDPTPTATQVPSPPVPPQGLVAPKDLGVRVSQSHRTSVQIAREAFGLNPVKGRAQAQQPNFQEGHRIETAQPGQTLAAPPLPNFPLATPTAPAPMPLASGLPGGFATVMPSMSADAVAAQTRPVHHLMFTAAVGQTYRLEMSSVAPNMLVSPFAHPKLIVANRNAVNFDRHGHSLLVTVAAGAPIGAYITGENPDDPLVALVFQPRPLPPQNYEMQVDGFVQKVGGAQTREQIEVSSEKHTQDVVALIEQTLSGEVPDGFGAVGHQHWPGGRSQGGLVVEPVQILSSGSEMLDVLSVTNTTQHSVSLEENDFYRQGVEGVALTSHVPLQPGESMRVCVLRRASKADANDTLMSVSRP